MRRLRWLAIASVLVLVAAGCGRDDESTDADEGGDSSTESTTAGA